MLWYYFMLIMFLSCPHKTVRLLNHGFGLLPESCAGVGLSLRCGHLDYLNLQFREILSVLCSVVCCVVCTRFI